jgi:hypothetical protein
VGTHDPAMTQLDPIMRMLFRSRHVYILLTSLVNLGIGVHYRPAEAPFTAF